MKFFVCVKHVPDSAATIKIRDKNQIDEKITFLLNPYDENAVTEAAALKARMEGAEVVAVCVGKKEAENTLRSALAMGADRGVLIGTDADPDSIVTARALQTAIERDGDPTVIFTGKESIDNEGMQTMFRLAANLDLPAASNVVSLTLENEKARVECETEGGARNVYELETPCVIGAGKGLNDPAYPRLPDIMKARKKEIARIDLEALGLDAPPGKMEVLELQPAVEDRKCVELKGTPEEMVRELVTILREEARVID
ncbi:MAG: electron transfer flavoprotein subunit beta/FixA family protein [Desulfobacterales bacterium]|nr:electron transfer flavoprotein subunit beta/FixA family protein [Desulfobacterales bacterium]